MGSGGRIGDEDSSNRPGSSKKKFSGQQEDIIPNIDFN